MKCAPGDEKKVCSALKQKNKEERRGQGNWLDALQPSEQHDNLPAAMARLESLPDDTVEGVNEKERAFAALHSEAAYRTSGNFLADA